MAFDDGHGSEDEAELRYTSLDSGSEEELDFGDATRAMDSLSVRTQRKQIRQELTDPSVSQTGMSFCNRDLPHPHVARYNRLHSLALDAGFVQTVSQVYPDFAVVGAPSPWRYCRRRNERPSLIALHPSANLRCGQWYVDPNGRQVRHKVPQHLPRRAPDER